MKKIFIVDMDTQFQKRVKSFCDKSKVEIQQYKSSIEILPLIDRERPDLIFIDLDVSDVSDFVMYDLLKQANTKFSIPVLVTFNEQSEEELNTYKKLKYNAEGFYKNPMTDGDIQSLLIKFLCVEENILKSQEEKTLEITKNDHSNSSTQIEEQEVIFADVSAHLDLDPKKESSLDIDDEITLPSHETSKKFKSDHGFKIIDSPFHSSPAKANQELDEELTETVVSVGDQKKLLSKPPPPPPQKDSSHDEDQTNKRLLQETKTIKQKVLLLTSQLVKKQKEFDKYKEKMDADNKELDNACDELKLRCIQLEESEEKLKKHVGKIKSKLASKEAELKKKTDEFENELAKKSDEKQKKDGDDLLAKYKEIEGQLRKKISKLEDEKKEIDDKYKSELDTRENSHKNLQREVDKLRGIENSFNVSISFLEEEKASLLENLSQEEKKIEALENEKETLSQTIKNLEKESSQLKKELKDKEKDCSQADEKYSQETKLNKEKLDFYKKKTKELEKLLNQALELIQESE